MISGMLGMKVLEEIKSRHNGKIRVVKSLGFGTYIQVEGLTQSGGVVEDIWHSTLRRVKGEKLKVESCLILGLGGGSAAKLVRKFWPEAEIVGVDSDIEMVKLGHKYLDLGKVGAEIQIQDAYKFITQNDKSKLETYDLILIDLYRGYEYPKKFETASFLESVRGRLTESGMAVFNRLYFEKNRPQAARLGRRLEKIFPNVEAFYPEANVMFICKI